MRRTNGMFVPGDLERAATVEPTGKFPEKGSK
jgi:hypothetical protein